MDQQKQPKPCLNCPRCNSTNTKFCYYNNYSLSQPRHFCKACKRYWTRGGTLRNVPVGGGCRKNNKRARRPQSSSAPNPPSSSNQLVFQMGTSIAAAAAADRCRPNDDNLLAPPFYALAIMTSSATYENLVQQQPSSYSDMKVNMNNDQTDHLLLSGYSNNHIVGVGYPSIAPPPTSAYQQDEELATRPETAGRVQQDHQLLQRLFPFQATQQHQPISSIIAQGHHTGNRQAQRWNSDHVENVPESHNGSSYWTGDRNVASWPHDHLANNNMNG